MSIPGKSFTGLIFTDWQGLEITIKEIIKRKSCFYNLIDSKEEVDN